MLKLLAFCVFDQKAEAYLRPFFAETKGLAVRSFSDVVNDPQHEMAKHAEDYSLFCIGTFDVLTGVLVSNIESIGQAVTFKREVTK